MAYMNVLIICFSQTGNTKKIAEKICSGITEKGHRCKIADIKVADLTRSADYDLIGIGTPVFYYREPVNIKNLIISMEKGEGKHCFIFCTHGSIIGNTFYYMKDELTRRGYEVIGAFDTYAESSLQFYPEVMHTAKHPDEEEIIKAEKFGMKICDISKKIKNGESSLIPEFKLIDDTWWFKDSEMLKQENLRQLFPKFIINPDKCTMCMLCQDNCPADAVNMEAEPPEFQKPGCIFCLFCQKICPEGAIETDWSIVSEFTRPNLKKYVNELKEAEKQGKFTPYVDYEKII
jgi:flavodoxin/NAD-dependent dihydropyrimidine dehydrogenase PreA subunit